jgi:hypothetical protein
MAGRNAALERRCNYMFYLMLRCRYRSQHSLTSRHVDAASPKFKLGQFNHVCGDSHRSYLID